LLILGIIQMFWGMAYLCEEYSVPSISVFCKRNRISEDVAGAIFIGTGLSLPVLFASFVGIFFSNTSIGIGTVLGGNIYNHLMNIAISIYVAPNQTLTLDPIPFTREICFYIVSCFLVIYAAHSDISVVQSISTAFTQETWTKCLSIPWTASLLLILNYFVFVVVDSYFDRILYVFKDIYLRIMQYRSLSGFTGSHGSGDQGSTHSDDCDENRSSHGKPLRCSHFEYSFY
jgi:Ca2+/Na+ antiporter